MLFSCGNRPSSRPVMKTASNSRPLAACTVMSWTASWPCCAWLSPASSAACDRKAASGVMPSGATMGASTTPGISVEDASVWGTTPAGMPS